MAKKGRKHDGRSSDLTFSWMLTTLGAEWQQWQELAAEWLAATNTGVDRKRRVLCDFFESYLCEFAPYASNVTLFFKGYKGHICSTEELEAIVRRSKKHPDEVAQAINHPCDFIDFIIEKVFSEEDDNGNIVPLVQNPLSKVKIQGSAIETVRNPLPYRYIQDLRQILCPLPDKTQLAVIEQNLKDDESLLPAYHYRHFKHWAWAQQQAGGDWFDVEP